MDQEITVTKNWLKNVVIGMNFCPFAAAPFKKEQVRYVIDKAVKDEKRLELFATELENMSTNNEVETLLIIYPNQFEDLYDYLDWVTLCEDAIEELGYEGVFQVASFHPKYLFHGAVESDASNYTNRSPYPMVHVIREDSVEKAREIHPDIESIPETNIIKARKKGLESMKLLLASCFSSPN